MIKKKREIAGWYTEALQEAQYVFTPAIGDYRTHTWFVYVIRITNGKRNKAMESLHGLGIQTKPYLPVIHLQPFMKKMFGFKKGDFPIAERVASETLALPFYIGLQKKDIQYITKQLKKIIYE